jgi:prepilin peptidase CpaA
VLRSSIPVVVGAVASLGGASAIVDLNTRRVPNPLTFGTAVLGVALAAFHATPVGVAGAFGGLAVGLALMLPGHVIGATGAGDVKLFAALGTFLGPSRIGIAFIYVALVGGVIAVVIARRRQRLGATLGRTAAILRTGGAAADEIERPSANNRFAYAPAIALGAIAAALGL